MSLDYNFANVDNYKEVCLTQNGKNEEGEPLYRVEVVTECLIWKTMVIGMDVITEDNAREFAVRCRMWENAFGPSWYKGVENEEGKVERVDQYITYDDVIKRVGLYTNASRMTKAQFMKHFAERVRNDAEYAIDYQKERGEAQ